MKPATVGLVPRKKPTPARPVAFLDVISRHYERKGMNRSDVVATLRTDTGLSFHTLQKAILGKRIKPESAATLAEWAFTKHGEVIDVAAMVTAPTEKQWQEAQQRTTSAK